MFTEIRNVRQERGSAGRRRWFESDGLELVVWQDATGGLAGFQLCYDWGKGEHALTWRPGAGFAHNGVDEGDASPLKNLTPVLTPDGVVPWAEVAARFAERSASLEPGLRQLISARLAAKS
jgi:hypothetical protein